jgi:protein gp37
MAHFRLPIYKEAKIKHKIIICEPLLSKIDLSPYLDNTIEEVLVGGESGNEARVCDYDWVLDIRDQCIRAGVPFSFRQTGARLQKDGKIYRIRRELQHIQAKKAGIDT